MLIYFLVQDIFSLIFLILVDKPIETFRKCHRIILKTAATVKK